MIGEHAAAGLAGSGGPMPYLDAIQRSFGRYDVTGFTAHVSGPAADACQAIGASAYASGNAAAFARAPDLHTAAHEAAHLIQQRHGVHLSDGVGQAGDLYERHADAVADRVVSGESAEDLLSEGAKSVVSVSEGNNGPGGGVQRQEVDDPASIGFPGDWTRTDRQALNGTFETANLHNLASGDCGQYVQIEERRDFYRWFYNYTATRGYTTRWALAAALVANGAHQVAHMGAISEIAAQLTGTVSDELQGMMRIGNQVIFDNVFPKLQQLLAGGPLTGAAALQWDMQVLSEEQTLIQPLYSSVSSNTISQLQAIAQQSGIAGLGAWVTGGAEVSAGRHNNAGDMPGFGGNNIQDIDQRWHYGMQVGDQFTPGGTGYNPVTHPRPVAGPSYTHGAELSFVNRRPNLHMLDACLDSPPDAASARVLSLLRALTLDEQSELMSDRSPDGTQYSKRLAECSFSMSSLTTTILERSNMTRGIPAILAGYTSGAAQRPAFLSSFNAEVTRYRNLARVTRWLPPPQMGF